MEKECKTRVLVLYSWENNKYQNEHAKEWARAFCKEMEKADTSLKVECDTLFLPKSNFKKPLREKINSYEKIVTIVTKSYNSKIENKMGVVSWEETVYEERIKREANEASIIFILKEKNISLPEKWDGFTSYDLSWLNVRDFNTTENATEKLRDDFLNIARFLRGVPDYSIQDGKEETDFPNSNSAKDYATLFSIKPDIEQADPFNKLVSFISRNKNQRSFVTKYIQAGPSGKSNLGENLTPRLFDEYFYVKRPKNLDVEYRDKIAELFEDSSYNTLCVQSGRGSGKSVFINTLYLRGERRAKRYNYLSCCIDFESTSNVNINKDTLLAQRVKKLYREMWKSTPNESGNAKNFRELWKTRFINNLQKLSSISYPANEDSYFTLAQLITGVQEAVKLLKKTGEDGVEQLDEHYASRLKEVNESLSQERDVHFVVLLLLLITLYNSRPRTDERYIIVFDNLETYDVGDRINKISRFAGMCHHILSTVFDELAIGDDFKLKFTFVIVLRTSTTVLFGDIAYDLFYGSEYIVDLQHHDFEIEALLKKLLFLEQYIPDAKASVLYKRLMQYIKLLIPQSQIDNYLENGEWPDDIQIAEFARKQYFPLFNNDYRTATEKINRVFDNPSLEAKMRRLLEQAQVESGELYKSMIHGARMLLIHSIFAYYQDNKILESIGFSKLHGNDNHSMTRMVLAYCYWDYQKHIFLGNRSETYEGIKLSKLIDTFKYFCESEIITTILFNLSIYTREFYNTQFSLRGWGNLLVFSDTQEKLTRQNLNDSINKYISGDTDNIANRCKKISVRLSLAGECFTEYYSRSFEFLNARCEDKENRTPLFAITDYRQAVEKISRIRGIIENCIAKLLISCERSCKLYKGQNETFDCIMNMNNPGVEILSCSLFLRFQECMDLIREAIDYVDRYRITQFYLHKNRTQNTELLSQIIEIYKLYKAASTELSEMKGNTTKLKQFSEYWCYPNNQIFSRNIRAKEDSRVRLIRNYYARGGEDIEYAIKQVEQTPLTRIFDVINNQANRLQKEKPK